MRDSFIFYKSFYEAIKDLPRDIQGEVYTAIMEYSLYGITTENLKPVARSIFTLIKPQIDQQGIGFNILKSFHWNWKGGISSENHIIRNSDEARKWRKEVFERDKYICQNCKKIGGILHAHHIKSFSEYKELRFDINNGITLCKVCHNNEHKKNEGNFFIKI